MSDYANGMTFPLSMPYCMAWTLLHDTAAINNPPILERIWKIGGSCWSEAKVMVESWPIYYREL